MNGSAPLCDEAKLECPAGCQSCVSTTRSIAHHVVDPRHDLVAAGDRQCPPDESLSAGRLRSVLSSFSSPSASFRSQCYVGYCQWHHGAQPSSPLTSAVVRPPIRSWMRSAGHRQREQSRRRAAHQAYLHGVEMAADIGGVDMASRSIGVPGPPTPCRWHMAWPRQAARAWVAAGHMPQRGVLKLAAFTGECRLTIAVNPSAPPSAVIRSSVICSPSGFRSSIADCKFPAMCRQTGWRRQPQSRRGGAAQPATRSRGGWSRKTASSFEAELRHRSVLFIHGSVVNSFALTRAAAGSSSPMTAILP